MTSPLGHAALVTMMASVPQRAAAVRVGRMTRLNPVMGPVSKAASISVMRSAPQLCNRTLAHDRHRRATAALKRHQRPLCPDGSDGPGKSAASGRLPCARAATIRRTRRQVFALPRR